MLLREGERYGLHGHTGGYYSVNDMLVEVRKSTRLEKAEVGGDRMWSACALGRAGVAAMDHLGMLGGDDGHGGGRYLPQRTTVIFGPSDPNKLGRTPLGATTSEDPVEGDEEARRHAWASYALNMVAVSTGFDKLPEYAINVVERVTGVRIDEVLITAPHGFWYGQQGHAQAVGCSCRSADNVALVEASLQPDAMVRCTHTVRFAQPQSACGYPNTIEGVVAYLNDFERRDTAYIAAYLEERGY